jgi:hypothetical protein
MQRICGQARSTKSKKQTLGQLTRELQAIALLPELPGKGCLRQRREPTRRPVSQADDRDGRPREPKGWRNHLIRAIP